MTFRALLAQRSGDDLSVSLTDMNDADLMPGNVMINVEYSSINFKDALGLLDYAPIMTTLPLIPGIDLAGTVESSSDSRFAAGDRVVANGFALGASHHGGYAQRASVNADWLVKLPAAISTRDAMAIGTAGYTAMLSVLALEHNGISPSSGDVLVTGAAGGVGSCAVAILAKLGYRVIASTGRTAESEYLRSLGAAQVIDRETLGGEVQAIAGERWAAAIDSVGSNTLANVIAQTSYRGVVTACGLAQGTDLPGSVLPFILRNVTLCGIDSVNCPLSLRQVAWDRLAHDLDAGRLGEIASEVGLAGVTAAAQSLLGGQIRGRIVVNVNA